MPKCTKCGVDKVREDFYFNRKNGVWFRKCKECVRGYFADWKRRNPGYESGSLGSRFGGWSDGISPAMAVHRGIASSIGKDRLWRWNATRYRKENGQVRLRDKIRGVTSRVGLGKVRKAPGWLGCGALEFRKWIEGQFVGNMTWENHGERWEFDHIQPLASFDLKDPEQFRKAGHYTNVRPLYRTKNKGKMARITEPQMPLMLPMGAVPCGTI